MILDMPANYGPWIPAEPGPVDLSNAAPAASSWAERLDAARAALDAAEDERAWVDLANDLHGAHDPAEAARAAIVAAYWARYRL